MSYLYRNKFIVGLVIVTIVLLFIMGVSDSGRTKATAVENVTGNILSPVQNFFYNIGHFFQDSVRFFSDSKILSAQNKELTARIDLLEQENRAIQELKDENRRLREMLDLKPKMEQFDIVGADIVAKEPGNWFNTFTINKGTGDGLKVNCAVITSKGLVGHIYDIGTGWAKVISVIDTESAVAGLIVRTRDVAVVKGDLTLQKEGLCKMTYISKGANIITSDLIETSGLGGIYPKGLLVGKVRELKSEQEGVSQFAIVEPAVDFERLREVFIIKNSQNTTE